MNLSRLVVISIAAVSAQVTNEATFPNATVIAASQASVSRTERSVPRGPEVQRLGSVDFPNSCSADVQDDVQTALALLHSFQYKLAETKFATATQKDSQCAIGYWGQAMTLYHPLWDWPRVETLKKGHEYILQAERLNAKTDRERAYIAALGAFYREDPAPNQALRVQAYSKAMGDLCEKYPNDDEAASLFALSLLSLPAGTDKGLANQIKAIAILERLYAARPDHPGAAHYLIHAADTSQLALLGLDAARRYADIAPSSPHALHMPSHIFARLGFWQDVIKSNLASMAAAEHNSISHVDDGSGDQLHAAMYLMYAYLQTGRDKDARDVIDQIQTVPSASPREIASNQALFEALYSVETHDWELAARLHPHEGAYPYATLRTYWARIIGAARSGNVDQARMDMEKLNEVRTIMVEHMRKMGAQMFMGHPVDLGESVQQLEASAWFAYAQRRPEEGVKKLRAALAKEDSYSVESMTVPAREMLGDLLTELGNTQGALTDYEAVLTEAPGRFNALYGAARALQSLDSVDGARTYYSSLAKTCDPLSARKELQEARSFLLRNRNTH